MSHSKLQQLTNLILVTVLNNDIIFPLVDEDYLFKCDAALGQVVLRIAKHTANQKPYCVLSDHMTSRKI